MVLITLAGDVSADEMTAALAADTENFRRNGYALLLVDGRRLGSISPEARRVCNHILSETWPYNGPYQGSIAIFGLNRSMQVLMGLLVRATQLMRPHSRQVSFLSHGEEARSWLRTRRAVYAAQAPGPR